MSEGRDEVAFIQAMLDFEAALAGACGRAGLIPLDAAAAIAAECTASMFDASSIFMRSLAHATPVIPLVDDLRDRVPDAREFVHFGATSQDVLDTAMGILSRDAIDSVVADLATIGDRLAELAQRHAAAIQIGRTLFQHAQPTTFGLVCAGWLGAVDAARAELRGVRRKLAVQLGGPVGAREAFRHKGSEVAADMAAHLGLADPGVPWHTDRHIIGALAGAVAISSAALATIARNVVLLSASEIREVSEDRPGGSSSMPHKRNPAGATLVLAATHQIPGIVAGLLSGLAVDFQRPAGSWQAEWPQIHRLFELLGTAAAASVELVADLIVDTDRMRGNAGRPATPALVGAAKAIIDRAITHHEEAA